MLKKLFECFLLLSYCVCIFAVCPAEINHYSLTHEEQSQWSKVEIIMESKPSLIDYCMYILIDYLHTDENLIIDATVERIPITYQGISTDRTPVVPMLKCYTDTNKYLGFVKGYNGTAVSINYENNKFTLDAVVELDYVPWVAVQQMSKGTRLEVCDSILEAQARQNYIKPFRKVTTTKLDVVKVLQAPSDGGNLRLGTLKCIAADGTTRIFISALKPLFVGDTVCELKKSNKYENIFEIGPPILVRNWPKENI